MEFDKGGFSIREYTSHIRTVDIQKCWPFAGEITEDLIKSLLPPISVAKFRWWSHELASLLTKSPVADDDDSNPNFRRKSKPRKKRSIVEICATAAPKFELPRNEDDSDVLIGSKRKRTKDHIVQKKIKINQVTEEAQEKVDCENCRLWIQDSSDVMSLSSKMAGSVSKVHGSEFQIPLTLKEKRNVCLVKSPDHAHQFERYQSGNLSHVASIELCCLELNRLSLSSDDDQSQGRVNDVLGLERKGHLAQPIQSLISTWSESPYRSGSSFSQPALADIRCGTWLYQSPIDPLLDKRMDKTVLYRHRHVGESVLGFPLNLQGGLVDATREGYSCRSLDLSGLCIGSSKNKHSTEPAFTEKRQKYFSARLGLDETFTEIAHFTYTNDGECCDTVHSPVSVVNQSSHTINMSKQNGLNQNLNNRNMILKPDGSCLHNNQATMRLMGNDSVGTSYSGMVRTGERIIAPDYSYLGSHTYQGLQWQRTTTLEQNRNQVLLHDTSKNPYPLFNEPHVSLSSRSRTELVPDSASPPTILNPCCSLSSFPLFDKDPNVHGYAFEQPNSFTLSQQQLPLPHDYTNVDIALQPDATKPSVSTRWSQAPWSQSSFQSPWSGVHLNNHVSDNPYEKAFVLFSICKKASNSSCFSMLVLE